MAFVTVFMLITHVQMNFLLELSVRVKKAHSDDVLSSDSNQTTVCVRL
jgi:hypothetical protein